jgi:hypothetical protein
VIPLSAFAAAALAVSVSNDDESDLNFSDWFIENAFVSSNSLEDVLELVKQRCSQISDSQLESDFLVISGILASMIQDLILKERVESALDALELHWALVKRVDGFYKFPSAVASLLALESDIHRERGDIKAVEKSELLLWKLLKQYEWVEDDPERRRQQRANTAFSLALAFASSGECDSAEYFARDFVHVVRTLSLVNDDEVEYQILHSSTQAFAQSSDSDSLIHGARRKSPYGPDGPEPASHNVANAKLMMSLLSSSLRVHFYFKNVAPSPCADLFEYAARDIYDVIFSIDPRFLPHWKDLKRNMRMSTKQEVAMQRNPEL